jgi:hypothetical protein
MLKLLDNDKLKKTSINFNVVLFPKDLLDVDANEFFLLKVLQMC